MSIYNITGEVKTIGNGSGSHGLIASYYQSEEDLTDYPTWDDLTPDLIRIDKTIDFNITDGDDLLPPHNFIYNYGIRWQGYILIDTSEPVLLETEDDIDLICENGDYITLENSSQFTLTSDDGARLYIDDELVINNDGPHSPEDATGTISLDSGFHKIEIWFFQNEGGAELQFWNGNKDSFVSSNVLYTNPITSNVYTEHNIVSSGGAIGGGTGIVSEPVPEHSTTTYNIISFGGALINFEGNLGYIPGSITEFAIQCSIVPLRTPIFKMSRNGYIATLTRCNQKITKELLKYISDRNDH